jgi:hypothetical protein
MYAEKIFKSFYDVEDPRFFGKWEDIEEQALEAHKETINLDYTQVSRIEDVRMLSQILVDYLDSLKAPIINLACLETLEIVAQRLKKGEEIDRPDELKDVAFDLRADQSASQ